VNAVEIGLWLSRDKARGKLQIGGTRFADSNSASCRWWNRVVDGAMLRRFTAMIFIESKKASGAIVISVKNHRVEKSRKCGKWWGSTQVSEHVTSVGHWMDSKEERDE
jgi:hypothetical protein